MSDFLDMGGYAFFVWGSYLGMAIVFVWNLLSARARHHELRRRINESQNRSDDA